MILEKARGAAARPRGREKSANNLNFHLNIHLRTCLNFIYIFIPICIILYFLGVGRPINHLPPIQEDHILFHLRLFEQLFFSKQTGRQYYACTARLLLSLLAFLTWVFPRTITALIQTLRGGQSLLKSPIFHHPRPFCAQDRASRLRRVFTRTLISCLSYLTFGLFAILFAVILAVILLRRSQIHPEESDFCPGGAQHIQQLRQGFKIAKLRTIAALLIAPSSSNQTIVLNKIVGYFIPYFKIGEIPKMDEPENPYPGVYQPAKNRLPLEEAINLRDTEFRKGAAKEEAAREAAKLLKQGGKDTPTNKAANLATEDAKFILTDEEEGPTNRAAILATRVVTFAPEPNYVRPPRWDEYMHDRRAWEADGRDVLRNSLNEPPTSTDSQPVGPIRSVIRKTKSTIFGTRSIQEDEDAPTVPRQNFVSRAASSLLGSNVDRRERPSVVGGRSFSLPEGTTGPTRIRNLEMEAAARAMGFELDLSNRFGLPEMILGDGALPTHIQEEALSTMGTVAASSIYDNEDHYADDMVTIFGEGDTEVISENQKAPRTPPCAAQVPISVTQGGLVDAEESQPDHVASIANAFSPSTLDLMKDFGTPPREETRSLQGSSTFVMGDEARKDMENIGAPPKMGDFGTYRAKQLNSNENTKHHVETGALAENIVTNGDDKDSASRSTRHDEVVSLAKALCEAKDPEIRDFIAHQLAAITRAEALNAIMKSCNMPLKEAEKLLQYDNGCGIPARAHGAQQTPTKTGSSNSKGSFGGEPGGKRTSHKKSNSQEGGFFKGLLGTSEPSLVAWEKLQKRSLIEANAGRDDPDLAAKLKVSSRQLPPEAPKPASKEPVPKAKSGASNFLRRFSSMDNLKQKDIKPSGSSESKNCSTRNDSQHSHSSQSKDASLTSITEESAGGFKSPEEASARSFNSTSRAMACEDEANINGDDNSKVLRFSPPSRSPPPVPTHPTFKSVVNEETEQKPSTGAEEPTTPQHSNLNTSLPEINPREASQGIRDARESGNKGMEWAKKCIFRK